MIRGIAIFLVLWVFVTAAITGFRMLNGSEKWSVVKTLSYAGMTAVIASLVLGIAVILF